MLGRALQEQSNAPGRKAFNSSQHPCTIVHALKPSRTATLNALARFGPQAKNPLKRSASQALVDVPSSNRQNSAMSNSSVMGVSQVSSRTFGALSQDGGRVGKLHDTVYFDENDFEDDANIDLDADEPLLSNNPPANQISYPTLPLPDLTQPVLGAKSLANGPSIEWSSSPMQHKLPPPPAKPTTRRKLPWLDEQTEQPPIYPPLPAFSTSSIDLCGAYSANNGFDKTVQDSGRDVFTPLPKDQAHSPYPWNKTASALKEEQKKLRQGNKKLVKNNQAHKASEVTALARNQTRKRANIARVCLSTEQRKVLELVTEEKRSVFFTGSAGTGKSVLLREIIKSLRVIHNLQPDRVAVTASTGLAACNVGGVTLHSFAGIGLGKEDVPELVKKIKRNQKAKSRWMRTKVLIVDEISMVDGDLFDKLEAVARNIRNSGRPFGGIQLVITGDFFQLPPVPDYGKVAKFSFDAATWNTSIEHTIGLSQVFRQKDPVFANMLNEMRLGKLSQRSIDVFRSLDRPLGDFNGDFEATELFPTRQEVDNANGNRMRNLTGKSWDYKAEDGGSIQDRVQRDKLLSNCMAPPLISLKQGAHVMLIKNIDETLVNGSVGRVVAFMDEKTFDIYHEDEDQFQAVDAMGSDDDTRQSRKKLKAMINKDLAGDTSQKWPLVRFALVDGSSRDLLCQRESWKIELPNGEVQASRNQVPLILAWALSIHKAQGQTLERVKVDLGRIFEKGQAYVALSRATCQEGLQVMRFDPKKVMAHEKVRTFYKSLYSVGETEKPNVSGFGSATDKVVARNDNEQDFVQRVHDSDDDNDALLEMYR